MMFKTLCNHFYDHSKVWLQALLLAAVAGFLLWLGLNVAANLSHQPFPFGFGFLKSEAGFPISPSLISFHETSSLGRAFVVGLLNTLLVAGIGLVLATLIGFSIGFARLANNWLVRWLAFAYVELFRNVPLLLVLFFGYFGILRQLPPPKASFTFAGAYLNNRGLFLPSLNLSDGSFAWDWPARKGLSISGGLELTPEFAALVAALSIYTAAYIAEIVRAGIQSIGEGQTQAAAALGLAPSQISRFVILPQALRLIIPPLTSQYLNLTKNSSLAVAIAYPDLVSVFAGTTLAKTGHAIEIIGITMSVYLTLSLLTAGLLNWRNRARWAA